MLQSSAGSRRSAMPPHAGSGSPVHQTSASSSPTFLDSVLLDTVVLNGRCRDNATTAIGKTSGPCCIEVSFLLADPPALTRCVAYCPHLTYGNFFEEPPLIIGADGAFLLIGVNFPTRPDGSDSTDLFVYKSGPGKPSLQLLPHPYPTGYHSKRMGILSCGDHCLVVVPGRRFDANGRVSLDIFSSKTGFWSTNVASPPPGVDWYCGLFEPTKVFAVGGGSMAFVDLRDCIVLINSVEGDPKVHLIQLPQLMSDNVDKLGVGIYVSDGLPCLDKVRDVTCSDGWFRFIEMGTTPFNLQWTANMYKRKVVCADNVGWHPCGTVDSATLKPAESCYPYLFPEIFQNNKLALNNMIISFPTLDQKNYDIVYMMAKMENADPNGWVLVVNTKTKELEKLAPFSAGSLHLHRIYMQFEFPKHLSSMNLGAFDTNGSMLNIKMPLVLYVVSILLARLKFRQFEKYFTQERPSQMEVWALLHAGVAAASAINVHIDQVAELATSCGFGKAAYDAATIFRRASKDIENLLLRYCQKDPTARGNAVGDKISIAVGALDKLLRTLPSSLLDTGRSMIPIYEESLPSSLLDTGRSMIPIYDESVNDKSFAGSFEVLSCANVSDIRINDAYDESVNDKSFAGGCEVLNYANVSDIGIIDAVSCSS